jgi:N-glycosylase/DNA lyase
MKVLLPNRTIFSLDSTLCCGQTFRWEKQDGWWYGVVRDKALKIRQIGNQLEFEGASETFVTTYFGLKDDLPRIYREIGKDEHMRRAIGAFRGLRILRQDPWECLVSFICATYKNIAAIRRMLHELSRRYGRQTGFERYSFHAFPEIGALAQATVGDLQKCGLGYRAGYVSQTAKKIHELNYDFESLKRMGYSKTKEELLQFPGVGQKVADCVLLFSLGKLDAFPVDVWITRAVLGHYSSMLPKELIRRMRSEKGVSPKNRERLNAFGRQHFGRYAGYAQEYLYAYERSQH